MFEWIDHIYLKNPIQFEDRYKQVKAELDRVGIQAERFSLNQTSNDPKERDKFATDDFFACIQDAKDKGYKNCLILEDDICFNDNHLHLMENVKYFIKFMEYDLFYLGGTFTERPENYADHIVRIKGMWALQSIIVNSKAYDKILALRHPDNFGDDTIKNKIQPDGKCYAVVPRITYQKQGYSYLQNCDINYDGWMKDGDTWEYKPL